MILKKPMPQNSVNENLIAKIRFCFQRLALSVVCLLLICCKDSGEVFGQLPDSGTGGPDIRQPSSVWVVEKDGKRLYLGGTIHLLRKKDHPLPEVFHRAYADSKRVVFELPPDDNNNDKAVARMRELGVYYGDVGVDKHVSLETLNSFRKWLKKHDLPFEPFRMMRPWLLALTISTTEYQSIGAESEYGVDHYFEKKAKKDRKRTAGLETVEFQLNIFAGMNAELQEKLLLQTLAEVEAIGKNFDDLLHAWRVGDADWIQQFMYRDADAFPDLMEEFLIKRNRSWVKPVMEYLKNGPTTFVLVGAGHLGGEQGLIELLRKEGCTIEQLR